MLHNWLKLLLGDVITLQRGFDLPNRERIPGNVPVVSSSGISGTHSEAKVSAPGVVTGRYGTIGQVFYIQEDYWPLNTTLFVKDFKGNDPLFVSFLLRTIDFQSCSDKSSVPGLNRNDLHLIKVKLPPLSEQKAIAHILGTLDDKIELNRQMNRTLETIAWTIFNSWFQENNFPETWQMLPLEQCMAEIIDYRGKTPKKTTSGIPLITAKIVKNGRISEPEEYIAIEDYDPWMRRGFPKCGDVVMTTEAPLGEIAQLDGRKVALAQRLITLRGKPGVIDNTYLRFLMLSSFVQEQLHARATGTTVLGIRQSELRKVNLVVPPFNEQIEISRTLGSLNSKINANDEQSRTLSAIRDELLPKLLSGKIRFGEIDSVLGGVG